MSREKQIEEMAEYIFGNAITHDTQFKEDCRSIARDLYNEGYRKQSEWISVDERLPYKRGRYVVCRKLHTGALCVDILNYDPNYDGHATWYYFDSEWGDCEVDSVTHWMPLPEAPKMKGGAE